MKISAERRPPRRQSVRVDAAVLAAGRGKRMGAAKHLLEVDGEPMLDHVVRALLDCRVERVTLVLRPGDEAGVERARELGVGIAFAEDADEGRAASVRAAVGSATSEADALLIALADQPHLRSEDFDALIAEFGTGAAGIVHASYVGQRGTPVLFARHHFAALLELRGKSGGRRLIVANPEDSVAVELDPERGRDLDRPEDLR